MNSFWSSHGSQTTRLRFSLRLLLGRQHDDYHTGNDDDDDAFKLDYPLLLNGISPNTHQTMVDACLQGGRRCVCVGETNRMSPSPVVSPVNKTSLYGFKTNGRKQTTTTTSTTAGITKFESHKHKLYILATYNQSIMNCIQKFGYSWPRAQQTILAAATFACGWTAGKSQT